MGIRTHDYVRINGDRCVLAFDDGTGAFTISIDGTVVYDSSAGTSAAELEYLDIVALGTGAASKAVVLDAGEDFIWPATGILTYGVLKDPAGTLLTATAAELNKLDDSLAANLLTRGAGVDTAESYASGIFRNGSLITTRIVVDLSTLVGSATDLDIIGESAAASCHFGQITAAKCGTLIGGKVTCLEVPAGGATDLDFYSASVGTGTQDVIITDAALGTETALVTSGGAWASGTTKGMTALPTADDYLYIVNGAGAAGGTFTAGKFLVELFGLGA